MLTSHLPLDSLSNPCPPDSAHHPKKAWTKKSEPAARAAAMSCSSIEPEDDLRILAANDHKLQTCGYYYGSLSWVDASQTLRQCAVGTFLVRDSEHSSYLYTLSVQTRKGPTSCRIEYSDGRFRLDSARQLARKMPLFDCVPYLIDFYVHLSRHWPQKDSKALAPVWLDMDESNSTDVPVQIYQPLYKRMRSLQHLCRVAMAKGILGQSCCKTAYRTMEEPSAQVSRTLQQEPQYKDLPNRIKDYLLQYPYSQ